MSQKRFLSFIGKNRFFMSADKSLKVYVPDDHTSSDTPLAESCVHADFPSSADDFMEN